MRAALTVFLLASLCLIAEPSMAQDAGAKQAARDRELLRRAQLAQRQAEEALAAAQQEKAKLEAALAEARAKLSAVGDDAARERAKAAKLATSSAVVEKERDQVLADKAAVAARLAKAEAEIASLRGQISTSERTLSERDVDLAKVRGTYEKAEAARAECVRKNGELHALVLEISERYRNVGVWDALRRREPFTGKRQVEVDNLLEQVRDQADAARVNAGR